MTPLKTKLAEQIKYEITLYESLVRQKPHYVDALAALADLYTKVGQIRKGLELDERLTELCPKDDTVFYNLACSLSLTGQLKKSLEALKRALEFGYSDFVHLHHDSDLERLRKSKRYGPVLRLLLTSHKRK